MQLFKITTITITTAIFFACSSVALAAQSYIKQWNTAVIIGSIPHSNFKYYLEPQLRLIADPYIFNQSFLLGGLGYQVNHEWMLFAGTGWIYSKSSQGRTTNEIRIWQQSSWRVVNNAAMLLDSRTRIEERKITNYSQYATRLRQRLWIHLPFKHFPEYSFSCFDEVFLDLNHPVWTSPYFFSQNRLFVGVGKQLTTTILLDAGYMNQYLHARQTQVDHVLLLTFNIRI